MVNYITEILQFFKIINIFNFYHYFSNFTESLLVIFNNDLDESLVAKAIGGVLNNVPDWEGHRGDRDKSKKQI